mgnify:CR=1 FL=1
MPNYKTMYFSLFNSVTDAINLLQEAQQNSEYRYLESSEKQELHLQTTAKMRKCHRTRKRVNIQKPHKPF